MAEPNKNTPSLPSKAGREIGASGTYIYRGYITSEEYVVDLQGMYGLNQYDIMRRSDSTVHGVLQVVKNPIIAAKWDIEPASDDANDVFIAEYVKRELFDRSIRFQDVARQSLTALDFGHWVGEKVYELTEDEGKTMIGLKKIASRKQRSILRWAIDGDKPGITQILPNGDKSEIPRGKLIYTVNDQEGDNYQGISLLRYAYKPWKIKDSLELMNAIALEKLAIPVPILRKGVDNKTVQEADLEKARMLIRNWRANQSAYLELPAGLEIEFPAINGASVKDTLPTIQHQNEQIWSSVLASFMSLGQGGNSGSRALSGDLTTLFYKALEAVARMLQQSYQEDLIKDLVDLNFSDLPNGYPKLVFSNISDDDFKSIADSVSSLLTAGGLHMDAEVENRLRSMLNLPELSEDMKENYAERTAPVATPEAPTDTKDAKPATDTKNVDEAKKTDMPTDPKTESSLVQEARTLNEKILASILKDD